MTVTQDFSAPLVAVVAATSRQGSSVIKHLIESNVPYRLRGITTDAKRAVATTFLEAGVDMIETPLTVKDQNAARSAFAGATFVFAGTDFWSHLDMQREIDEGKMLVNAAKTAAVKLLVWSSLPNATKLSGGKYPHVYHLDSKAIVTDYAKEIGISFVEVQCGWYVENFVNTGMLVKRADGTFRLQSPNDANTMVYPLIHTASDFGLFVRRIIEADDIPPGSCVSAFGQLLNGAQIVDQFQKVTGKKLVYKQISHEEYIRKIVAPPLHFPLTNALDPLINAQEMLEMCLFFEEFGYYGPGTPCLPEGLARKPRTWADYVGEIDWDKL